MVLGRALRDRADDIRGRWLGRADGCAAAFARTFVRHVGALEEGVFFGGLDEPTLPLKNLDRTIRHADALFIEWPRPEGELAIVSNPPYLGVRKLRRELGDEYVEKLFDRFPDNRAADYVTYWFTRG